MSKNGSNNIPVEEIIEENPVMEQSGEPEHSKDFEKYKRYYDSGFWNKAMLRNVVRKGKLTPEEYEEITGEAY